uniref:Uncharacterized protein n=1 Tax=Onchocerca volvulus TaxID=6282 RepID=A0A8R1XWH0_ONCVO
MRSPYVRKIEESENSTPTCRNSKCPPQDPNLRLIPTYQSSGSKKNEEVQVCTVNIVKLPRSCGLMHSR